ncbi:preprotein translocase subunit YajC [Clostridium homopropionicum DSM 5847]|uniref:Preprotein translocase subunit YajC n=1 Tax=Clostridium homopropionicum DSM 5847 TaxID=1121318 RepID=A0A0L6ZDP2_9CLOT|nr:preprotein translocase subunit YajC [Clostridium homopropionicum]KOA21085.1 preprotein translocase subunit YajC [Clostridium homopropionicum DSM 5847]SFF97656.1 preprotein translocase subunit YajC [Clostridium homopropionicum]
MIQDGNTVAVAISFLFMLLLFYIAILVPEKKMKNKFNSMLLSLKVKDNIITNAGIVGTVCEIKEKYIIIATGPDRVKIEIDKKNIASVLNKEIEDKKVE